MARISRRFRFAAALLMTVTACTMATQAGAAIGNGNGNGTDVSISGSGIVRMAISGSALGSVRQGQVTIRSRGAQVATSGNCSRRARLVICSGSALSFSALHGRVQIVVRGQGINISASGSGRVAVAGRGQIAVGGTQHQWSRPGQLYLLGAAAQGARQGRARRV